MQGGRVTPLNARVTVRGDAAAVYGVSEQVGREAGDADSLANKDGLRPSTLDSSLSTKIKAKE
jgi:hypothetical protein